MRLLALIVFPLSLLAQDAALERARQVNLERAATMPNFVADEVLKRYEGRAGSSRLRLVDTFEAEITVKGVEVTRQNWRRNGRPRPPESGFIPGTGFGGDLKPLFSPDCPTLLQFAGQEETGGAAMLAYRFQSPPDGCFFPLFGPTSFNSERHGRILIDQTTGRLVRIEEEATGLPEKYSFVQRNQVANWGSVKIGDTSHWLPTGEEFVWRTSSGGLYRVDVAYKNHRHFEATTNVSYGK